MAAGNPNWKDGKSGNPGGRPKMPEALSNLLKKGAEEAIREIIHLSQKGKSEKIRFAASEYLVDRVYGKPTQINDVNVANNLNDWMKQLAENQVKGKKVESENT